jgi:integrase
MSEVSKRSYLYRRGHTFYFRKRIPTELISLYDGRKEITRSLKTNDQKEANKLWLKAVQEIEKEFETKRFQVDEPSPTPASIHYPIKELLKVADNWLKVIDDNDTREAILNLDKWSKGEVEDFIDNQKLDISLLRGEMAGEKIFMGSENPNYGESNIQKLLEEKHISLDRDSDDYNILKKYIIQRLIQLSEKRISFFTDIGMRDRELNSFFKQRNPSSKKENTSHFETDSSLKIQELLEQYLSEKQINLNSQKTINGYRYMVNLFISFLGGDRATASLTRTDFVTFRNHLLEYPSNATKHFRGLGFFETIRQGKKRGLPTLSGRTINKIIQTLSTLFRYAEENNLIQQFFTKGLSVKLDKGKKSTRVPFSIEDLNAIFGGEFYKGIESPTSFKGHRKSYSRYWVPLVSLFSGMRQNEICQLYADDIKQIDGIPCFCIDTETNGERKPDKHLKNRNAHRTIPIHPTLIHLGFLDYVFSIKNHNQPRLFPDLKYRESTQNYSDSVNRWFHEHLIKTGVKKDKTKCFHSFRHTFRDAMREANIPLDRAQRLGGWKESDGTESLYGQGHKVETLYNELTKVSYDGLQLEHLLAHSSVFAKRGRSRLV